MAAPFSPLAGRVAGKLLGLAGCLALIVSTLMACRPSPDHVVIYAAQDRVFAEPVFRAFEAMTGVEVRALYDNEATKTTGLANRLVAESGRPQADVWWSNEEMRTRQLVRRGVLESRWTTFGARQRVLVVATNGVEALGATPGLAALTNATLRGRVVLAYPLFGTTSAHLLALRQRWGEEAWRGWCRALVENRPLLVDGNSMVVRWVASGRADVGLTDSDDVAFGQREGLSVVAIPLPVDEGLVIPNAVAVVRGTRRPGPARELADYLAGDTVRRGLEAVGALDDPGAAPHEPGLGRLDDAGWASLLDGMEEGLRWIEATFLR